jgi:hypothetical protein
MMDGIIATSYKEGDKFYIDPMKLLPLSRFLPQPKYEPIYLLFPALIACCFVKNGTKMPHSFVFFCT